MTTTEDRFAIQTGAGRIPLLPVEPAGDAAEFVRQHRAELRAAVAEQGAVLVRGLSITDRDTAGAVMAGIAEQLMTDTEAFAARESYADGTYSATVWPANQRMCMHHEQSYRRTAPSLMQFVCLTPAASGGETTVADASEVLQALPTELVERFERDGWILVRTYNDEIGASWQESFGTSDRAEVERYCAEQGIEAEWLAEDGLRTRQRRSAVITHPVTGRRCWFNQVAFLSEWTMEEEVREYLVEVFGADSLPFTTTYGDGRPIEEEVVALLNQTYLDHTRTEPWQAGDLLLVDNLAFAHSREPYRGERSVVVALADPVRIDGDVVTGSGVSA